MKKVLIFLIFLLQFTLLNAHTVPFQRAATLGKGMALSMLERYWLGDPTNNYADYFNMNDVYKRKNELLIMKQMGIKTLRLPVWFSGWYSSSSTNPTLLTPQYFAAVDSFVAWTSQLNMNLIIDYHQGNLLPTNLGSETTRIANIWKKVAQRYAYTTAGRIFYEIYNEPSEITSDQWRTAANTIVDAIRTVDQAHTVIVGGVQFNDIQYLNPLGTLKDNNVIYSFHFYEPFIFTHQGASWVQNGVPVATKYLPFPYDASKMPAMNPLVRGTWGESSYNAYASNATTQTIVNQLNAAYRWQQANNRPVYCGEFGSDVFFADATSRCTLMKTIRTTLEGWKIPYAWWDWDGGFRMFNGTTPSVSALPDCFFDAWGMANPNPPTNNPPTSSGNDLSVNVKSNNTAYAPYSIVNYTVTVKNNGSGAFSNVKIEFPFPALTNNGGKATPSVGDWSEYCFANVKCYTWTIPFLAGNASATLSVPLYNLNTGSPLVTTAKLLSSIPTDGQTSNNQSTLTLYKIASANAVLNKPTALIPVVVQSIYPSITEGDIMLQVESLMEKEVAFSILNAIGLTLKTRHKKVEIGENRLPFDVWDLPQGIYFISTEGENGRNRPMKFVKM